MKKAYKDKIPKFKSLEEERIFWDTHSLEDVFDDLEEVKVLVKRRPKTTVSIRMDEDELKQIKELSKKLGVKYTALIRSSTRIGLSKVAKLAK